MTESLRDYARLPDCWTLSPASLCHTGGMQRGFSRWRAGPGHGEKPRELSQAARATILTEDRWWFTSLHSFTLSASFCTASLRLKISLQAPRGIGSAALTG